MKSLFLKTFLGLVLTAVLGIILCVSILVYFSLELPKISSLADYKPPVESKVLARDGTVLAVLGIEKRDVIQVDDVPPIIIESFLAAEDSKFHEHDGVNYSGIFRAFLANLKAGKVVQGGSTITQQVAKSLLLSNERAISRKIKDFLLAYKIEKRFSKKEILFLYLNQVYLGGGYYGIRAAFKGYFDKDLSQTTIAEAAMVAGLLAAPGRYSPYINPKKAKVRQAYVLGRLYKTGKINTLQYTEALRETMKFRIRKPSKVLAKYFTDWIKRRVIEEVGKERFLRDGFKVYTTLDYNLQKLAEWEVEKGVREIDKRQGFKGPLQKLENDEAFANYNIKRRISMYKKESSFFTLGEDYTPVYELEYDPIEHEKRSDHMINFRKEMGSKKYVSGYYPEDSFIKYIKRKKLYEAVVTKTNDVTRIVHIDIMGIAGIIPYDGFKWAHKRDISENRKTYPYITKPSTILKPGDVILVRVLNKKARLIPNIYKDKKNIYEKMPKKKLQLLKSQHYLLCDLEQKLDVEGALVSMHAHTGEILSFVGGVDFSKSQFNRVIQSRRQPGSAFKPILFAAALENGYTPSSVIIDSPEALGGVDDTLNWKPRNYDNKFKGPMTFRNALEQSRNIPTIKIARKIGVKRMSDFIKRIGLKTEFKQDLSFSLGSFGVTLLNLVSTYGIFPNGGKKVLPRAIVSIIDRDGNHYKLPGPNEHKEEKQDDEDEKSKYLKLASDIASDEDKNDEEQDINIFHSTLSDTQVYDARLAYVMTNLLSGVIAHGTGRQAKNISPFIGGKTGTTNNYVDAWFLGFSSNVVTGVWTGFDDNTTLGWGETGAKSALPIWKEYMKYAIKQYGENSFLAPPGIINVKINKETGVPSGAEEENTFAESFVQGTQPGSEMETSPEKELFKELAENEQKPMFEEDDYYNAQ